MSTEVDWQAMFFWPDAKRRQWWIGHFLGTVTKINREDICRAFGVSVPQASKDLGEWIKAHPGAVVYDKSAKCYVLAGGAQ